MVYTNFPDGVTSFGVPMIGGIGGIPLTGKWWFCNYATGSDSNADSGSPGAPPDMPLKTIGRALELAVAGRNDVVVIMGDGTTAATQRLTATLVWNKDATHLVGMTAPTLEAQRARISTLTTATTNINPLMQITASGCIFANFSFFQGVGQSATDEQLIEITGDRNYFGHIQFGGMGATAGAARSGSYCILLNGAEENLFESCSVGVETIDRTAANASVRIRTGSRRNVFRWCQFPMSTSTTTPLFVDANATGSINGGSNTFQFCSFRNSGAGALAVTCTTAADSGGVLFFDASTTSAAKWAAATTLVRVAGYPVATGFTTGKFTNAADS